MTEPAFPSAVSLMEQALGLVRRADAVTWFVYLGGIVPFFAILLFEVTELVQNPFALERLMLTSFALAVLYFWLHMCQSVFCARLYCILTEQPGSLKKHFSAGWSCQSVLAGSKLLLWPIALILIVPHAVVTMFYQHSLLPDEESGRSHWRAAALASGKDAVYRQSQAIWMLVLVFVLRAILWINLFFLLFVLPQLWKILTGMEGNITRAPEVLLNPTSFTALGILAYLGLDPVVKAACVLRRFTRQSESSGQDLRLRIAGLQRATAALLLLALFCAPVRANVSAGQMKDAVHSAFRDPANIWSLPVVEQRKPAVGAVEAFVDSIIDHISQAVRAVSKWVRRIFSGDRNLARTKQSSTSTRDVSILVACFFALLAVAVLFSLWSRRKRPKPQLATAVDAANAPTPLPDDLEAAGQTEDQWLSLAQQYRAAGNFRLALRALYLSELAALAQGSMVSLARGKSNLDYLREVQRRARRLGGEFVDAFRANVQLFERSWYGAYPATEDTVESFSRNSRFLALKLTPEA